MKILRIRNGTNHITNDNNIQFFYQMQGDLLLQQWKQAKQICCRIIEICKMTHLGIGNVKGIILSQGEKQTSKQFINVYNVVYRLCMTKEKEENRVQMVYKDYKDIMKCAVLEISPLLLEEKDIYRLDILKKIWDCFSDIQKRLNNMFAYLNRSFHIKEGKIEELDKTSTNIIINTLFLQASINQYQILYFKEIDKIRKNSNFSNHKILSNLVDIFYRIHLKIVKTATNKKSRTIFTELYGHYQKNSREYYSRRYRTLKQLKPSEYFIVVNDIYNLEKQIAETCFIITTENIFNKQFSEQLIQAYKATLLQSQYGLKYILRQGQIRVLKLIVELYLKLTKSLDGFKQQFQDFIFQQMKKYIDECKRELVLKKSLSIYCSFVEKIIRKNQELLQILEAVAAVGDFSQFYKSGIQKAFIHSKLNVPIQQLLAIYTDTKFRRQIEEGQFQRQVENIITLFNCAQNKDLFLLKYSQRLAKRILDISEAGLHNNGVFISNLRRSCGINYTQNLQTLITEYQISKDLQQNFNSIQITQKLPISVTLVVFSQCAWPTQTILDLPIQLLPKQIHQSQHCINIFKNEYISKKKLKISGLQSKIRWTYYFDQDLKEKNDTCYFDTNCLQGALLFHVYRSRPQRISLEFLQHLLIKVNPKLIRENLNKLSDSNQNILIKTIDGDDIFYEFNLKLKTTKKLLSYQHGSSQEEEKLFQQNDISKDREIVLDANISKFMKSKKITNYKNLFEQIIKMIRVFVPQNKDIKLAVDRLIAKEILDRDEKDKDIIRYKD